MPAEPLWWDEAKRILRALCILAIALGVLWVLAETVWLIGIKAVWGYVVDSIQEITGLNTFLVRAIATIGSIPLLWGIVDVFSFKSKSRRFAFTVIALYIILFNFAMYAATRNQNIRFVDGEVMRHCAITPKGVYCADKPGFDPAYGIKLEPMTAERIRLFEAYEKRLASGSFQPVKLAHDTIVFDPVNGEAVLFFTTLSSGEYRFFNGPGFDTATGAELRPASPAVVQAYWRALEQAEQAARQAVHTKRARQTQSAEAQKRVDQQQARMAQLAARKAELSGFFNKVSVSANQLDVAVAIRVRNQPDQLGVNTLIDALRSELTSARFHGTVFRTSFLASNRADVLFDGNLQIWRDARGFGLLPNMDRVIVGVIGTDCDPGYQDTFRCDVTFEYRAFDANGEPLGDGIVREVGAGFDRRGAAEEGLAKMAKPLRVNLRTILGG